MPDTFMREALQMAKLAMQSDEVPVGAVVVLRNEIIGRGYNQTIGANDPSAHAEIMALRDASKYLGNHRLIDCHMYVTLEPCMMCAGALVQARVKSVYFAATEPRSGSVISCDDLLSKTYHNHQVGYCQGMLKEESVALLKTFFQSKRQKALLDAR